MSPPASAAREQGGAWPAPAKLNLFLHILGRRDDGYHDLQTAYQFLDFGDRLRFEPRDDGRIRRLVGLEGLAEKDDLVVSAARRLQSETGVSAGAEITIDKCIPAGAGLGGGSSDAATTLVALNALWSTGLSRDDLATLGAGLGADVPVFVLGRAAWAEGIGDILTPVDFPAPWYAVVYPGISVATPDVFDHPELTRNSAPITISCFIRSGGRNDCTRVVRERYAEVGRALDWLGRRGNARLTGTGASVFAEFDSEDEARAALRGLPGAWQGFVARGLNRSPLLDLA